MWMVVVAMLAQSNECRFKADWWLTAPVEMQTSSGVILGTMPPRFSRDVPAPRAEVVLRGEVAEVSVVHRGTRVKFFTKKLASLINTANTPCSELRLGSPTSVTTNDPMIMPPDTLPSEDGARTAALLPSQIEIYDAPSKRSVKSQVCRRALKLFTRSSEEVGELVAGAPFEVRAENEHWISVRLDDAFESTQLFVKRTAFIDCRK